MSRSDDEHAGRIVQRSTSDIATVIADYRAGRAEFHPMVDVIEVRLNSMIGVIDSEWLEEWRGHWNRLEYVKACMIDEGRDEFEAGEDEMVGDALDALESMTRP